MKIFNLDLSSKVDRLKFILLMMGTGVFITIVTFFTYNHVRSPDFCIKCHVMGPEYYTWQVSSHANFQCVDCHVTANFEQGFTQGLKEISGNSISIVRNTVSYFRDDYRLPIRMTFPIKDYVCLRCHSEAREASPTGDLVIPHSVHQGSQVSCVRCHSGVAHGDIASRRVTANVSLSKWNQEKGKNQMQIQYTKTPMEDCMNCHDRRGAPLDCDACHTNSKEPISHKSSSFLTEHGKAALEDLDSCHLCHGYSGYANGEEKSFINKEKGLVSQLLLKPSVKKSSMEVVRYSRNNLFCVDCHSKKPVTHNAPNFINRHAIEGKKSSSACFTCHSNRPEELNTVTTTTCSSCHPSTHSARDWRSTHPTEVTGKINQSCFSCHSKNNCTNCHYNFK